MTKQRKARRCLAAATALVLAATGVSTAVAATQVTLKNPGKITAVGPVNPANGFPSWYEDSTGTRLELCLDGANPLCGFLPGDIPNEGAPISFPENFPEEAFYMLAGSDLDLPGGGRAVLVLALEAAFANSVTAGDQVVFGRQRVAVEGGPANSTLEFRHPYGTITIDTDASGDGRLVEDITPAIENFNTPLKSNIGPFLMWDPQAAPARPEGYLGDPDEEHTVVGSPFGYNNFSVTGAGLNLTTDQFSLMGKLATTQGVPTVPTVPATVARDVTGDGKADLTARDSNGTLWTYTGTGTGLYDRRIEVGPGWNVMTAISAAGDLTGDGKADLTARDRDGILWTYTGTGTGLYDRRIQVGPGWNVMTAISSAGDLTGDGKADLTARDSNGTLWTYTGTGTGLYDRRIEVGPGWNVMTAISSTGDLTGDGKADLTARDRDGILWTYTGTGTGLYDRRIQVGPGWNVMTAISSTGDINGDGKADLTARDRDGILWTYTGTGTGLYDRRIQVGPGWNIMTAIS
ncbi:VCBS repeat-containing protein [Arthrobacter sp. Z1-9]